jgi:hypothetical protein
MIVSPSPIYQPSTSTQARDLRSNRVEQTERADFRDEQAARERQAKPDNNLYLRIETLEKALKQEARNTSQAQSDLIELDALPTPADSYVSVRDFESTPHLIDLVV